MKKVVLLCLILGGCAGGFQYQLGKPQVNPEEVQKIVQATSQPAMTQIGKAIGVLDQRLQALEPKKAAPKK